MTEESNGTRILLSATREIEATLRSSFKEAIVRNVNSQQDLLGEVESDSADVAVIQVDGGALQHTVDLAKKAAAIDKNISIVILSDDRTVEALRGEVESVSVLREQIVCVSDASGRPALTSEVRAALGRARRRRQYRSLIETGSESAAPPHDPEPEISATPIGQRRVAFLAEAGELLSASLDYGKTLAEVVRLAVPYIADWCAVDVVEADGNLRRLAAEHRDPDKTELAMMIQERWPARTDAPFGVPKVLRTGLPEYYSEIPDSLVEASAMDEEHLGILRQIGLRSVIIVPLIARGRTLGTISLVTAGSGRLYGAADLSLAEDLARRAALAVDNARLFREIQQTEQRFRALVQTIEAIVWEADRDLNFTFVNEGAEVMLGYPVGSWLTDPGFFTRILHPEDRERTIGFLKHVAREGGEKHFESRLLDCDNKLIWVKNMAYAVTDRDGVVGSIRGLTVDITDQKRVESLQSAQHLTMRVIAEASSLGDAAPLILKSVCSSLGWDVGALWLSDKHADRLRLLDFWTQPGLKVSEFETQSRQVEFTRGMAFPGRVWESGMPAWMVDVTKETSFSRAEAARKVGLNSGFAFPIIGGGEAIGVIEFFDRQQREPDEEVLQTMGTIGRQIGQFLKRREAEDALREREAQLAYQAAVLESQSEGTIEGILVVSREGTIESYNRRFLEMWRIPEEALGSDNAILGALVENLVEPEEWITQGQFLFDNPAEVRRAEIPLKGDRVFDLWTQPLKGKDGAYYGRAWYFRDITEIKSNEKALQQSKERFEILARTSPTILGMFPDYEPMLQRLAELIVPALADWCAVDLLEEGGSIRRLAVAHADPSKAAIAKQLKELPPDPNGKAAVLEVIRTGRSDLQATVSDERLVAAARNAEHLRLLREIGHRSSMIVPLSARGRVFGTMTLVSAESGRQFGPSDLALAEDLARRAAISIDNARLYNETNRIARTLQQSLLPPGIPEIPEVDLATLYLPAGEGNEVGGDFYDVFPTGRGGWAVVIGDVCGKGADAAAMTGLARHTIRAAAMQTRKPTRVLAMLNEAMIQSSPNNRFLTVAYSRLRPAQQRLHLTVACGGHPLPLIIRGDGVVEAAGRPGTLIGLFPDAEAHERPVDLHPGDAVVFYTDGVTEARSKSGTYGEARLRALLKSCAGLGAGEILRAIKGSIEDYQEGALRDDVALIVVRMPN